MKRGGWGLGLGFFILISAIIFLGLSIEEKEDFKLNYEDEMSVDKDNSIEESIYNPLNELKLVDNKEIYREDEDSHIDRLYITLLPPGSSEAVTFEELHNSINDSNRDYVSDDNDPVVEMVFSTDREYLATNPYPVPNATIEIRGQSSRFASQKSYKIKLFDDTKKWKGFKTINLNKHASDSLRIRNKLSFDYFEILPDFSSLRTGFVELYIRDLSSKTKEDKFKSYGLYTFIEQYNKRFLRRHNLDPKGHLYKAEFFEFYRYPDNIKSKEDITYESNKFEKILEVRGNEDHGKLIDMLENVNDYNRDINEVVDKHFDRDNLLTWLGVNILMNNYDTNSRNFALYSPLNSDKWFFIPWDYDGAWTEKKYRGKWRKGISAYWNMVLFNRFFKDMDNIEALSKKIEELSTVINEENTNKFLDSYYASVKESIFKPPDIDYLRITQRSYEKEYYSLGKVTENNKAYYYKSLQNPMPFFLGEPEYEGGSHKFVWSASYDLQDDDLSYTFILSTDYEFKNIIAEYRDLQIMSCRVDNLKPGEYFWKVIVYDSKGNWQEAFDQFIENGKEAHGVRKFIVN